MHAERGCRAGSGGGERRLNVDNKSAAGAAPAAAGLPASRPVNASLTGRNITKSN